MKKLAVFILAFVYITSSTGAVINMHYCMGKLAGWDLVQNTSKNCNNCGMKKADGKANGCCKDEHKILKNNADQKNTETVFQFMQLVASSLPTSFIDIPFINYGTVATALPLSHSPPGVGSVAVYIRNCTFLI